MDFELWATKIYLGLFGISGFNPSISKSTKWLKWVTKFTPGTCRECAKQHGKILDKNTITKSRPYVHENCHCLYEILLAILAGTATVDGIIGADYYLMSTKSLPKNYVTKEDAVSAGWESFKGNLRDILPYATMGGDIFFNDKGKLPVAAGRIWKEADINYKGGYRNTHRILYSNDGLMFVTYDHYLTFYEII